MARIPSTQALRALDSFARHGVVWKAAQELNLTRSAVSHQLRLLERDLGFALFNKVGTGIALTSRGKSYAADVRQALTLITQSASRHAGNELTGQLTVSCTPGFAANWLSAKIARFRSICPDVSLSIVLPPNLNDLANPDADLFVAFGDPAQSDARIDILREVAFTPLISPALLNRLGGLHKPEDVLRADLLHLTNRDDWRAWLAQAGVAQGDDRPGITYADMTQVYAAALNGQGIAMGDEFICHDAMAAGQLIRPFDLTVKPAKSYYLAIPPSRQTRASVIAFRDWILTELRH